MFIVGLVGFAVASAVGGAAPNIDTLVIARAVQGGFAASLAPAALSMITVIFTDMKELNKAFGIFGAVAGSSAAIGLMLGGLLTEYANWRWCMYVNIAFAIVGIIGGVTTPPTPTSPSSPYGARSSARQRSSGWSSVRPRPRPTAGPRQAH
jgi:MFS family permease